MENQEFFYIHYFAPARDLIVVQYPIVERRDHPALACRDYIRCKDGSYEKCFHALSHVLNWIRSGRLVNEKYQHRQEYLREVFKGLQNYGLDDLKLILRTKCIPIKAIKRKRHFFDDLSLWGILPRGELGLVV